MDHLLNQKTVLYKPSGVGHDIKNMLCINLEFVCTQCSNSYEKEKQEMDILLYIANNKNFESNAQSFHCYQKKLRVDFKMAATRLLANRKKESETEKRLCFRNFTTFAITYA